MKPLDFLSTSTLSLSPTFLKNKFESHSSAPPWSPSSSNAAPETKKGLESDVEQRRLRLKRAEELTAEQGVQQDQELNKLQKEHKARVSCSSPILSIHGFEMASDPRILHLYDGLNKDDTEADVTNSTLSGLDSRRGVGKHAVEFVTDADMHKKPKTTLC